MCIFVVLYIHRYTMDPWIYKHSFALMAIAHAQYCTADLAVVMETWFRCGALMARC